MTVIQTLKKYSDVEECFKLILLIVISEQITAKCVCWGVSICLFFLFEILMVSIPREWVYPDMTIELNNAYSVVLSIMVIILAFFLKLLHSFWNFCTCVSSVLKHVATGQCKNTNVGYGLESCLENHSKNLTLLCKHTREKGTAAIYCL